MQNVESVYALSPMQQSMLVRLLQAPELEEYPQQVRWTLAGDFDADAFRRAWREASARHPILRTAFFWEGLDEPLQVVRGRVEVPVEVLDWRGVPAAELEARLERWLREDRERGFDLHSAPLARVTCLRTGEREHRCVWSYHHLLLDGWSAALCLREVFALYESLCEGTVPRPEPARPFGDFVAWVGAQDRSRAERFWRTVLAGFAAPTPLGPARPRDPASPETPALAVATVPAPLVERLRGVARRHGLTLNTLLQGAWGLLLARYSGEEDVVFGAVSAGRPPGLPGVETMLGMFIGTVPVRVRARPCAPLLPWLRELQAAQAEARHFDHCSVQEIQGWSEVPPGERLFDTLLVFQNLPDVETRVGRVAGQEVRGVHRHATAAQVGHAVTLEVVPRDGLTLHLSYDARRLDRDAVERIPLHLEALLEGMADDPSRTLGELSPLTPEERARVLVEWNAPGAGPAPDRSLHEWFAEVASRRPDALAVTFEGRSLTYAELASRAARLAADLRALGVGPEARVGLCLERSPEMVVAILGVLRAGGAYVPLDPAWPAERLAYVLADAGVATLVTQEGVRGVLPEFGGTILSLDAPHPRPLPHEGGGEHDASPENLAYVIYTSGSTGRPKGVGVEHRQVVRLFTATEDRFGFGADDVWTLFHSYAFDFSVWEIWGALLYGGRLVIVPHPTSRSPEDLHALLARERVTVLSQTPSAFRQLAAVESEAELALRWVVFGGEALEPRALLPWLRRHGDGAPRLANMYGITETTVHVTWRGIGREDAEAGRGSVIGRAIADLRVYVLHAGGEPAPVGAPGEMYVGGAGVSRGYLGRPELTAERFVPDPYSGEAGARLYRSGDRARWTGAGELEYLGRADQQVKVRGFRIEPGEVEAQLVALAGVREAVVVAREDVPGEARLVAYVVPAAGAESPDAAELRARLAERLPAHMVPSAFVVLEGLPLTSNGKLDRGALPAPGGESGGGRAYAAPRTPTEEIVAGVWAEALGVERVGAHDDFFALGGHSLLATRVVSRLRRALGVEVPMRALFEAPTVAALAERVAAGARAEAPPVVPVDRTRPLPLSFAQRRLWLLDRMEPGSAAYNVPVALRLRGPLDEEALERALGEVVRRHETLRTVFRAAGGDEPVQVVLPPGPVALARIDLTWLSGGEREARLRELARREAACPFDLERGPVFRASLVRLDDGDAAALFTVHHVASDQWSSEVLVSELSALYAGSPLPDLPVQYADFAVWQRAWLTGDVLEREVGYWRGRLAGAPPLLELPTDRPRPAAASDRGGVRSLALAPATTAALRALSRREGATLFMTLAAGFQALLSRYGGEEDVSVGTPVAGRTRLETEGLIGFFVNTLVLRADLSADPGARGLLAQTRERVLEAQAHQDLPFERLVEELGVERSLGHAPLFQAMLTLADPRPASLRLPGVEVEPLETGSGATPFDLSLVLRDEGDRLVGSLEFRTDLFDGATAGRMLEHYRVLLEGMAADPERRVSALPLLPSAERARLLVEWNATERPFPRDRTLHELFAEQARRTPHAPAAVSDEAVLTYAGLDAAADALAARLRARGVGPEARVAVCVGRGVGFAVAVLGAMKAGGAYVPLDPAYPAERLRWMLEDSGARVVVTDGAAAGRVPEFGGEVVVLDTPHPRPLPHKGGGEHDESGARPEGALTPRPPLPMLGEGEHDLVEREDRSMEMPLPRNGGGWRARGEPGGGLQASPENLACVIYTSGSTGRPKGVASPHRPLVSFAADMAERLGLRSGDRVLQFASPAFDVVVEELFPTWLAGAAVVFSGADLFAPRELLRVVERHGVTAFELPTAYWQEWTHELVRSGERVPESVRVVLVGGERAAPERLADWARLGVPLVHVFGLTETACTSTTLRLEAGEDGSKWPNLPIGTPVGNTRVYVLDAHGEPAPTGVPGELFIGGEGVARGYLGRPELTAERFVPDPFAAETGARLYRTGDRVRWLAEGLLEFIGRMDHQVKIRGFRIETGEVEAVLTEHPAVREAFVTVREDGPGGKRLAAYLAPEKGAEVRADELAAYLGVRLPAYMVPSAFVVLETLPLTPNGKVDRAALPAPGVGAEEEYTAPRTRTEERLAAFWSEVLGIERVGAHDDFFRLGGHSLLALRVVSRARLALGVEIPVRALFEAPTVAGLAARGDVLLREGAAPEAPPVVPVPREGPLPLSFAQQRLWFLDQLEPGSAAYNVPFGIRLRGPLDAEILERAVSEVVRRHEVLRTVFRTGEGGTASQVVLLPAPFALRRACAADLAELAREEAETPFDLAAGPLLRGTLVRLGEEDAVALFTVHHIVSDEWSAALLVREVSALYTAFAEGRPSPLPELPVQYADYAAWQRAWLTGDVLERQLAYWRERLAGAPPLLDLPVDRPRSTVASAEGAVRAFTLPAELASSLRELGRATGATPFMVLLAGFQALLSRYSGEEDVSVGTPVAGRTRVETEGLIGFFVNTLVLRTDLSGGPTAGELVARVRERVLEAQTHQDLPFERLVDELRVERSFSHTPLFQVMFTLESAGGELRLRLGRVEAEPLETGTGVSPFELSLVVADDGEGLGGAVEYQTALRDAGTVERMLEHYRALLEGMAARPELPVAEIPLLAEPERRRVVEEWNVTERAFPRDRTLHELFAEQARRTPDAPAAVSGDAVLTYAELDAGADRLAARLRQLGAGPETRVALCVGRGLAFAIAMLGALRSGAAYVPLDPSYPAERLRWMLADSVARVVVTQAGMEERLPEFGGEMVVLDTPHPRPLPHKGGGEHDESGARPEEALTPRPPLPMLGEGEHDLVEREDRSMEMPLPRNGGGWRARGEPGGGAPEPTHAEASPENLAYVIYTSGSTGRPKGVAVPHRAVVNFAMDMAERLGLRGDDRFLQFASPGFDVVVEEVFPAWLSGAAVVFSGTDLPSPAELTRLVAEQRVTALELPTAYWHQWTHELARSGERVPESVRVVLVGERVSPERLAEWATLGVPLVHVFGLTETACTSAMLRLEAGEDGSRWPNLPVGTPTGNARLYVLDPALHPSPVGVPGELFVGGEGVARGYLGRPELTAERFVPDPFSGVPGARLYRTGDRVRWLAEGRLEFIGRMDHQVKIRGFRIETGEVEAVLTEHPQVREAFVMVREDGPGDRRLVGYAVANGSGAPAADELRAWLRGRLPEHTVPSALVLLEALPLTPNGKTDRAALPAPEGGRPGREHVAPRGPVEEVVAGIWDEVLGTRGIGVTDDFFEAGGHSLLATQVVSRVRQSLAVEVPLRTLFEEPTVEALARAAVRHEPKSGQTEKVARMLRRVASMSLEDVQRMLRDKQAQ